MARRRAPLYEYVSSGRPRALPEQPAEEGGALTGRAVRIPIGVLFVGIAGGVLLVVMAYVAGHWRAEQMLRDEFEARTLESGRLLQAGHGQDGRTGGPSDDPMNRRDGSGAIGSHERDVAPVAPRTPGEWGAIESDPREVGMHYAHLLFGGLSGCLEVAGFCRERGLEAYVLRGDNARLAQLIVLPGVESKSSPAAEALLRRIHEVGAELHRERPSHGDLSDTYFLKFNG